MTGQWTKLSNSLVHKVPKRKDGLSHSESQFKTTEIPFLDHHFILTIKLSEIQKFDHTLSMAVNYQTLLIHS